MSKECKGYCDHHSGNMVKLEMLEKTTAKLELDLEKYKSYNEGKMDKFSSDLRELSKEFTNKLEENMREIKQLIANKESKKEGRFNTYLSSGILPSIILILGFLIEKYLK